MRLLTQRLIASALAACLLFGGLEAFLRISALEVWPTNAAAQPSASMDLPAPNVEPMLFEDAIGATPNPKYFDHDSAGWRNERALGDVDVLALGDSHTYGIGADRENTWPAQLGRMIDASVYQMALGGYNPTTFLRLAPEVLSHHPKIVVLSIYFGANYSQAFDETYKRQGNPRLLPFRTTDDAALARFEQAERIDARRWIRASYLDCQRPQRANDPALLTIENILDAPDLEPLSELPKPNYFTSVSVLAAEIEKRVTAARAAPYELGEPWCLNYSANGIKAILTPAYRLVNLETTDPRIVEGERIVIEATKVLRDMLSDAGARFFVVLMPTKEMAFQFTPENPSDPALLYITRLWKLEGAAHQRVAAALEADDIPVIEPLPALQALIAGGIDPYLGETGNGHPSKVGYEAVAKSVAAAIKGAL